MKLFGQHLPVSILLLVAAEFGSTGAAFALSAWVLLSPELLDSAQPAVLTWALVFSCAVIVGLTAMGLYQQKQRLGIEGVLARVALGLGIAAVCLAVLDALLPFGMGPEIWVASFGATLVLLSISRLTFLKFVDHEAFRRRVLIFGAGERAASVLSLRRRSDQRGFRIAAFIAAPGDKRTLDDERVVEQPGSLLAFATTHDVNEVVVAMDDRRSGFPIKDLLECKFAGIAVVDLLTFLERETGKVKVDLLNPGWLIFSEGFSAKPLPQIASRALDLFVSVALLVAALPIMVLVAAAIVIEDGLPVFYRQRRVGLHGKPFTLYKFRSMVNNAEADGPKWAGNDDPRVTRVGRLIRKLRLDELPQLFNVIGGSMSLVGPRPERPEFVEVLVHKIPYYQERHSVKPGITGWAQLCYPYGSSERDALEKLQYDLYYVKHKSLIFDLVVLLQTVEVIFWGKGAR